MQQKIMLQIPTPCHENWNDMTVPEHQNMNGRFCGSCQKNVVDFTNMTDAQVLAYFSTNKSNTCGRFENDQLNRFLAPPPPKQHWYKWMMAALVSGFIFSNKAKAQTKGKVGEVQVCQTNTDRRPISDTIIHKQITMGKMLFLPKPKYLLQGTVFDQKGSPIAGASVLVKNSNIGAATDLKGKFSIRYTNLINDPELSISSVGYISEERKLHLIDNKENIEVANIFLKTAATVLNQNVVVGGYVLIKRPKTSKMIDTLRKILPTIAIPANNKLIVSPNPAKAGSVIKLEFDKAGEYQLQVFDLQSSVLLSQKLNVFSDESKTAFNLPITIAKGEYIITAISLKSKTLLSGKLIVQ